MCPDLQAEGDTMCLLVWEKIGGGAQSGSSSLLSSLQPNFPPSDEPPKGLFQSLSCSSPSWRPRRSWTHCFNLTGWFTNSNSSSQPSKWREFPVRAQAYHLRGYGGNYKKVRFHLIVPTSHSIRLSIWGLRLPRKAANGPPRPPRWPGAENVKRHWVCPSPLPRFGVRLTML